MPPPHPCPARDRGRRPAQHQPRPGAAQPSGLRLRRSKRRCCGRNRQVQRSGLRPRSSRGSRGGGSSGGGNRFRRSSLRGGGRLWSSSLRSGRLRSDSPRRNWRHHRWPRDRPALRRPRWRGRRHSCGHRGHRLYTCRCAFCRAQGRGLPAFRVGTARHACPFHSRVAASGSACFVTTDNLRLHPQKGKRCEAAWQWRSRIPAASRSGGSGSSSR